MAKRKCEEEMPKLPSVPTQGNRKFQKGKKKSIAKRKCEEQESHSDSKTETDSDSDSESNLDLMSSHEVLEKSKAGKDKCF